VHAAGLGDGAVEVFLGGAPTDVPHRYRIASPRALLPLGIRQYIIHGDADVVVPARFSQAYSATAHSAGDDIRSDFLPGVDHMAFLDPASAAHQHLRRWLQSVA
jgi:pimeloyl-ACP methyl ester carboxylesterase